jgi:hypothetical protein
MSAIVNGLAKNGMIIRQLDEYDYDIGLGYPLQSASRSQSCGRKALRNISRHTEAYRRVNAKAAEAPEL